MREELLLKIAFAGRFIGLLFLFFLVQEGDSTFASLSFKEEGYGNLQGIVESVSQGKNVLRIQLKQDIHTTVLLFRPLDFAVQKGNRIEVIGTMQKENEIIAEQVRILG